MQSENIVVRNHIGCANGGAEVNIYHVTVACVFMLICICTCVCLSVECVCVCVCE